MIEELNPQALTQVSGGIWGHIAVGITILDAAYDFYQGYKSTRR
ncbi:hypothetical protein [Alteromonas sp. 14N.309.X.WAT.G.H12]